MSKGRKLAAESRREAVNRAYSKRPQPELGTCWLNEIGHGGKHEKSDRCSEWRAAPQPEPTPLGRCCESGMFGEPHECRKQPSPAGAPQMQITELQHIAWVIVHSGFEPEARLGGCCCDICSLLREQMEAIRKREAEEYVEALHKVIDYASPAGARESAEQFFNSLPEETKYKWAGEVKPHWAFEFSEAYAKKETERADAAERERNTFSTTIVRLDRALEFRQKEVESLRTELREANEALRPFTEIQPPYDHDDECSFCGTKEGEEHPATCYWVIAKALLSRKGEGS